MTLSRRGFIHGSGVSLLAAGCGSKKSAPVEQGSGSAAPAPVAAATVEGRVKPDQRPHYLVLVTLRGGFDNIMSVTPQEQDKVGDKIFCGYRADERVQGSQRLFGPLIGGLQRHDAELCLIHGVRSDTASHPDGMAMLARGSRVARSGSIVEDLAGQLAGNAPLKVLDLATLDGKVPMVEREAPKFAAARARAHQAQLEAMGLAPPQVKAIGGAFAVSGNLERFLHDARTDAAELDRSFPGLLGNHFRLAYQAIRGNWAKCVNVASRLLSFDSHSDNVRFQKELQPSTFADLATFVDLLKSTKNDFGSLYDQTTIAVFSEIGRFPRLNEQGGKDHWPENSWILLGNGIKKGLTVGGIDGVGKGVTVDFRTGGAATGDHARAIYLENAFATLVRVTGGDPTKLGYAKDAVIEAVVG